VAKRVRNVLIALIALLLAVAGVPVVQELTERSDAAPRRAAEATHGLRALSARLELGNGPAIAVPRSFLGISTEYWSLARYESTGKAFVRAVALLDAPGAGPVALRVGGFSADESYWFPAHAQHPSWAYPIGRPWLSAASRLVRGLHARLIFNLGMMLQAPALAASFAHAALRMLPAGSIAAFELGNEPDLHGHSPLYEPAHIPHSSFWRVLRLQVRKPYVFKDYLADFTSYARALASVAPRVALAGPALALPVARRSWIGRLIAARPRALAVITAHHYPLSKCQAPTARYYPSIERLLSPRSAQMSARFSRVVASVHRARLRFVISELGAVTCGGARGVSDTFAAALWAPDMLFALLRARVDAVYLHTRPLAYNGPFRLPHGRLGVWPVYYGVLMFSRAIADHARLLPIRLSSARGLDLSAWALRNDKRATVVVLINKGPRAARVRLALRRHGQALLERLLAPSVAVRRGATFAGQSLGADGRLHGRRRVQRLSPRAGGYSVEVPAYSAVLVRIPAR